MEIPAKMHPNMRVLTLLTSALLVAYASLGLACTPISRQL
jgi:hypothetical protein